MKTESIFRKLYFAKFIIGHILALALSAIVFYSLGNSDFGSAVFLVLLIWTFLISVSVTFYAVSKISIDDNGITNESLFLKKKTHINFSEIKDIENSAIERENGRGKIADGFQELHINLIDDNVLIISAECFENYNEIKLVLEDKLGIKARRHNRKQARFAIFSSPTKSAHE